MHQISKDGEFPNKFCLNANALKGIYLMNDQNFLQYWV